jgi:catechol 2,3-dioxygenase-like lactoylglutathione lyase family enzyme
MTSFEGDQENMVAYEKRRASAPVRGLSHASIRVRDIVATRDFYEGVLGLPMTWVLVDQDIFDGKACEFIYAWFEMGVGHLAFFEIPEGKGVPYEPSRDHHESYLGLEVSSLDELFRLERRLKEHGVECSMSNRGWATALYFNDPDGWPRGFSYHHDNADHVLNQAQAARDTFDKYVAKRRGATGVGEHAN